MKSVTFNELIPLYCFALIILFHGNNTER